MPLALDVKQTQMHLHHLAMLFPHLKELKISGFYETRVDFSGSLKECSSLEMFDLYLELIESRDFQGAMGILFPTASSSTLTSINITIEVDEYKQRHSADDDGNCICTLLANFEALKDLTYLPSCACLNQYLTKTQAILASFVTNLWDGYLD